MKKKSFNDDLMEYEASKSGKCSGKCCEKFYLPVSPEDLERMYEHHILRKTQNRDNSKTYEEWMESQSITRDIEMMYIMLIYLGTSTVIPETGMVRTDGKTHHTWTCRFFDKTNQRCTVYYMRPHFCRTFPNYEWTFENGNPVGKETLKICNCLYGGCTFKHNSSLAEKMNNLHREEKVW